MALEAEPLRKERDECEANDMVAGGVLPAGCTILTGMAGAPKGRRELEGAALTITAQLAGLGSLADVAAEPGDILYVATRAAAAAQRTRLSQAIGEEPENNVLWCEWQGRVDLAFAEELRATIAATGARVAVVDSAAAGLGSRQRERTVVAELSRAGKETGAAVVLLYPLTQKNLLDVRDPSTGLTEASDAVWELYLGPQGERTVFASVNGRCTVLQLPDAGPTRTRSASVAAESQSVGADVRAEAPDDGVLGAEDSSGEEL